MRHNVPVDGDLVGALVLTSRDIDQSFLCAYRRGIRQSADSLCLVQHPSGVDDGHKLNVIGRVRAVQIGVARRCCHCLFKASGQVEYLDARTGHRYRVPFIIVTLDDVDFGTL